MNILDLKNVAEKEVECDIVKINISFISKGKYVGEISKRSMDECERFLSEVENLGISPNRIHLVSDSVSDSYYKDDERVIAKRDIQIITTVDIPLINKVQEILQEGKYDFIFSLDYDVSNREEIHTELAGQAMKNSRGEAEILANNLGMKVAGIKSLEDKTYHDRNCWLAMEQECPLFDDIRSGFKKSDLLKANTINIKAELEIKWKLV